MGRVPAEYVARSDQQSVRHQAQLQTRKHKVTQHAE